MSDFHLIVWYLGSCFRGDLNASECGSVWQLAIIGVLVVSGIAILVGMRIRAARLHVGNRS